MQLEGNSGGKEVVDVVPMLKRVRSALAPEARKKRIKIELRHGLGEEALVLCVREKLRQALFNVAQNAIEAMAKAGGELAMRCQTEAGEVVTTFEDTGPGTNWEMAGHVLRPQFSTKKGGTGVGFALTRKVIQNHGGRIQLLSRPWQGTTVTIRLPRHEGNVEQA